MDDKLQLTKEILKKYNQSHLLDFYDELSDEEKELLLNQILKLNFEKIIDLYKKSFINENIDDIIVSPINHIEKNKLSKEEIQKYTEIGENIIKNNQVAVVTMAGGQGTRLGYKGPKGTYMLELEPQKKSLFQIISEDIVETNKKYSVVLDWYIMTSQENNVQTVSFFKENHFFGYPIDKIHFFTQDKLPLIDLNGNLILQETYMIKEAANGNGNVFNSLKNSSLIKLMEQNGTKWIFFGGIDNILLKNVDPLFLGLTIDKQLSVASKSIFKQEPLEKTAIYCKKNGKPAILDYVDIDLELSESVNPIDGTYLYREANILSHIMSFDAVKKVKDIELPYHRAFKKNAFVNAEGMKQVPREPNTFKFENFIFDAFSYFDDMLVFRVNEEEEFAPIKDFTGIYNPDTAIEKYLKYRN